MDLSDLIDRNAAFAPDKAAIRFGGLELTLCGSRAAHCERRARVEIAAGRARAATGSAILAANHPDTLVLLYACARLGAMLVPLNWRLAVPEQVYILCDASVKALVVEQAFAPVVEPLTAGAARRARRRPRLRARERRLPGGAARRCQRRRTQPPCRHLLSAAHRLHLGHDRSPQGRRAAPGGAGVERGHEPAHARHDRRGSYPHRAADVPRRRAEHPDHAGAAAGRHRHPACPLRARGDAGRDRARPADADGAGAGHHPGHDRASALGGDAGSTACAP